MNDSLIVDPINVDSLYSVLQSNTVTIDSLKLSLVAKNQILPFDQLSVTIGIVAFVAALLVVLAQVWVSHLQHKHQLKTAENQNSTQIEISHNKLVAEVVARSRHQWIQTITRRVVTAYGENAHILHS